MDVLHDRCAGLDIGMRDLKACVRTPGSTQRSRRHEIRTFATATKALLERRDWLVEQQVPSRDFIRTSRPVADERLFLLLVNAVVGGAATRTERG